MASVTATYDPNNDHISLSGSGYSMDDPAHVVYKHPDGITESWYIGIMEGNLDNNYIIAYHRTGIWTVDVYQGTEGHGKHSQAKLVASTTVTV